MKRLLVCLCAVAWGLGLIGCAKISDRVWRVVSAKVDAIGIVNQELLQGEMALAPDRTGTLTLGVQAVSVPVASASAPLDTDSTEAPVQAVAPAKAILSCVGPLRYTATQVGKVDLRCNDGSIAELQITLLADTKGFAYGHTASGPVSVTFGMNLQDARAYLTLPPNRTLTESTPDGPLVLQ